MDRDWRCNKYGPLGWMESIVKLLAIGVAIASLSIYQNDDSKTSTKRWVQFGFMVGAGVGFVALIAQRILDKEIFAIGFIVLQNVGHWLMTMTLILSNDPGPFIFTYVFLMILGDYIKLMYVFLAENPEVKFLNKFALLGITVVYILIFLVVLIMQVVIWLVDYE